MKRTDQRKSTSWKAGAAAAAALLVVGLTVTPAAAASGDDGRAKVSRGSSSSARSSSGGSGRAVSSRSGGSVSSRSSSGARSSSGSSATRPRSSSGGRAVDTRPSHGTVWRGDRHRGHGYYHYPSSYYWSFGLYGYYPGYWWGYPYYWGPGYGYYSPVVYASRPSYGMGALDLNVRPKNAEVYVNGQYVGLVRQYDGFPGHLWLDRGVYEVAFYRAGYETVFREFEIFSGLVIDVDIELQPGEAVMPVRPEPPESAAADGWDYRDRSTWDRSEDRPPGPSREGEAAARVELRVAPGDSSVYLDGRFLGTGDQVSGLSGALQVAAGEHTLEVLHPDYEPETVRFVAELGRDAVVDVRLDPRG